MRTMFFRLIRNLEYKKYPKYCGLRERRQFVCFLLTTFVELVFIPLNLIGLNNYPNNVVLSIYNWVHLAFAIILQVAYWKNKVSTNTALYIFYIAIVLKLSVESAFQAITQGLIVGHVFGNLGIALLMAGAALACRLKNLCVVLCLMLVIDLAICIYVDSFVRMFSEFRFFIVGYTFVFFVMVFNTKMVARGLRQPHNVDVKERKSLEMLANLHENELDKSMSLVNRLSEETKQGINENLMESFKKKEIEALNLRAICKDFTNSEIEICQLILRGKSTTDICNVLNKTRPNISSQRTHIRRKLGLETSEDLRTALMMKLDLLGD